VIDLRKGILILLISLLTLCLVGCISVAVPPEGGLDSSAQTEAQTEKETQTNAVTEPESDAQTTAPVTQSPTETTEEETTYSELHFPESGE
jgi:hypothetical protein